MPDPQLVHFASFPRTEPPTKLALEVVKAFIDHSESISTLQLEKGLTSDAVLEVLRPDLTSLGFEVESGKKEDEKIFRPVFFGDNATWSVHYEVDGYHAGERCGIEVEAGRAWMGNAVYKDLIQSLVMVGLDHLILAVPNSYKYSSSGRNTSNPAYQNTRGLLDTLYSHSRFKMPYRTTLIGY